MSISRRVTHVVVDNLGMDPLRDRSFEKIQNISSWSHYTVTDAEQFNAPLIAYNMYDNESLWWTILVYNGIPDAFSLKSGTRLRIPDLNAILSALADTAEPVNVNSVVEL